MRRAPAALGALAVATAATAGLATVVTPGVNAAVGTSATAGEPATTTLDPALVETLAQLRESSVASRSQSRPTALAATPTPTPTPTGPPPIVGTFAPIAGCTATVPVETPANGQLGDGDLCPIGDGHQLRADAAATYVAMDAAYAAAFGEPICITDSYRSYGSQQRLYWQKPGLAAVPGTSNHGWGVAVDLFCGVDSYGSAQHAWLEEHGPAYGWTNPPWARSGGSRPEPWHWEFDAALFG